MKQRNDLLNEVKDKLSNRYYLEQRDQELVNDCVDELLKAINYSRCCESDIELLPSKSDAALELANHQEKWAESHTDKENGIYALGFRHCFHYISYWVKQH